MCSAYSLPYFLETWHRLVPLPFSYMQMSITEVAESGELCTSAGGWCLPQHHASQWSINLKPSVGKLHLNDNVCKTMPDQKSLSGMHRFSQLRAAEKDIIYFSFFLSLLYRHSYLFILCPSWVTCPWGYMGHVFLCVCDRGGSSSSHPDLCCLLCY